MRIDKVFVLGIGALGLYAVYRLTQTTTAAQLPVPEAPQPVPLKVQTGPLPDKPGPVGEVPANIALVRGTPLKLEPGRWYHGRLETFGSATREQLMTEIELLGFGRAQVFMTPLDASQDIFQAFALANPGKGTRWFRARWPFVDPPLPPPNRPTAMTLIWAAAAPVMK